MEIRKCRITRKCRISEEAPRKLPCASPSERCMSRLCKKGREERYLRVCESQVTSMHDIVRREDRLRIRLDTTLFTHSEHLWLDMYKCSIVGHIALRALAKVPRPSRGPRIIRQSVFNQGLRNTHTTHSETWLKPWSVNSLRFCNNGRSK